jgi:hypothetical protein
MAQTLPFNSHICHMKLKLFFLSLAAVLLFSFSTAHKFYVSVTNIEYSENDNALQIKSRVFIDDLENVLEQRYGITSNLATDREATTADDYIEKYFKQKLTILLDGKVTNYDFLGKKYDDDVVICYIELPNVNLNQRKTLEIQNDVLTDIFEEQKNIVHVKWNGNKKSFVLIRDNNKGMLNL